MVKAKLKVVTPTGITPDEARMLRKRQQWRGRVLRICIEALESLDPLEEGWPRPLQAALDRFLRISDHVGSDMQRLLETEMVAPELETHRHGANYFLDNLIVFVRQRAEDRNRELGKPSRTPLDSLSQDELEAEIRAALDHSLEAVEVFLGDIITLEEFELEVANQRRRLQFILGCDKSLKDLAESNADIIDAGFEDFAKIVARFFRVLDRLKLDLPPLLDTHSPYPRLEEELARVADHLQSLVKEIIEPLERLRAQTERLEAPLGPLAAELAAMARALDSLIQVEPLATAAAGEGAPALRLLELLKLKSALAALDQAILRTTGTVVAPAREILATPGRESLEAPAARLSDDLERMAARLRVTRQQTLAPVFASLRQLEVVDNEVDVAELRSGLRELHRELPALREELVDPVRVGLEELREANTRLLKESICQQMGMVRSTFLQPSFAHIAATDPRSTHTPQYFYLKEFADEAHQSRQLLDYIYELWRYIEESQQTTIQGLRFNPKNLKLIADRVLMERRHVPAGRGWKELSDFLSNLKDRLVPRLQIACALPGIRFDDKNQLAAFADQLTESCGELLAQRETAYRLMKEIERVETGDEPEAVRHRYREVVLNVTCQEMAAKLRAISTTLLELMPYVGAMIGGIRMRTSLAFSRDEREG